MALSKASVEKAIAIFREINPDIQGEIGYYGPAPAPEECPADMIIAYGRKDDGGYEGVFTIVREQNCTAIAGLFNAKSLSMRNTSFAKKHGDDAIRIGFF